MDVPSLCRKCLMTENCIFGIDGKSEVEDVFFV